MCICLDFVCCFFVLFLFFGLMVEEFKNELRLFVLFSKELVFFRKWEKLIFLFCVGLVYFDCCLFNVLFLIEEFRKFFLCIVFYGGYVFWFILFFNVFVCGVNLLVWWINFEVGLFDMLWLLLVFEFLFMYWCFVLVVIFEIL